MSDVSQGEGWWQASDGKWYAPQPPGGAPPPGTWVPPAPAGNKGGGCLKGIGIATIVAVGGVILLIIIIAVAVSSSSKKSSSSSSNNGVSSNSNNSKNPPQADITITTCTVDEVLKFPKATGTLINHSSKRSNYIFQISFEQNNVRVAQGAGIESNIEPGQTANWESTGDKTNIVGPVTCRLTSVERLAS